MGKQIETKPSRTAEWVCICRAASSLEKNGCYKSNDSLALKFLSSPIRMLIQIPFYRTFHCRVGAPKGIYEYVIARTKYMDAVYQQAVQGELDPIVILGAGFDTRAIRFAVAGNHLSVYEFDSKNTQQTKLDLYKRNGVSIPPNVIFQPVDFEKESLSERLDAIGFPEGKRCLFIMEGVSMYLEPKSVDVTFQTVTSYMGPHSLIAFDYVYSDVLSREKNRYGETALVRSVSRVNEAWQFGIEQGTIDQFLSKYGLQLQNHMNPTDIETRYFRDIRGDVIGHVNGTHCLVTARKV
jgi:methyltransferase (TIGR00027 family)